jgi:hypothetical protein
MKIPLSFKESEKEIYDYVVNQLSPSIYLKGLIIEDMIRKSSPKAEQKEKRSCDLLDF